MAKSLEHGTILSKHYNERATILQDLSLFHDAITTYTRNIKRLNANCNAAHLAEHIFKNEPSCIYNKSCSCGSIGSRQIITCNVIVDILLQEGLQHMQRAINDVKNINSTCRSCGALAENSITYGKHIIIDTSIISDNRYVNRRLDIKHDLNSIAKSIVLNNTTYMLVGIAHYMQYKNSTNDGHYIAFTFAGTQ